jgi:hypothetical protein
LDIRINAGIFIEAWQQLFFGRSNVIDAFVAPSDMTAEYIETDFETEKISNKNLQVDVTPESDQDRLNLSLQKMVTNLRQWWRRFGTLYLTDGDSALKLVGSYVYTPMKGDRQRCIDAGDNVYLAKSMDTDKFLSLLRVWLY